MSNAFGRRSGIARDSLEPVQAEPAVGAGFSLRKPALGLLAGFGVVALLFGMHVAAMKGFGRALDQHWAEDAGYPAVDDAYKRSGSSDRLLEQVHNDCKSRSDFVGRDKIYGDGISSDGVTIGRAVSYLSCLASERPVRFCQTPHRAHLLAALKDYYRLKAKVREEQAFTREAFASTSPPASESDPRLIAAMKALVAGGYVSRRELIAAAGGWPNDLDLVLRGIELKQKGCA